MRFVEMQTSSSIKNGPTSGHYHTSETNNSFDSALAAACAELENCRAEGREDLSSAFVDLLYSLFRIRAQTLKWNWHGCKHVLISEIVQECVLNFWRGSSRHGKMRENLRNLSGTSLKAYVAGTVHLLTLRQQWIALKTEERQRGYWVAPAAMNQKPGDDGNARPWWDSVLDGAQSNAFHSQAISPLDLADVMLPGESGWDPGVIEAAVEFFASTGHTDFSAILLGENRKICRPVADSKRTAQRRQLEKKTKLRLALMK